MIGRSELLGGHYILNQESLSDKGSLLKGCYLTDSLVNQNKSENKVIVMHRRLGHPSLSYMKKLFPELFLNNEITSFNCDVCILAKQSRSVYHTHLYVPSNPFTMVHSDVWGPSRVTTLNGKRWFITLIDDHTRLTWVYLMKDKSEVETVFKQFYEMIKTQFHTQIQILRSDNGTEYFNQYLGGYLIEKGIVHQSSCVKTPQQNGVAERKNRHLLEVARCLLLSSKCPKTFWGEAVLTATYLINRVPSKVIGYKTPLSMFQTCFPKNKLVNNLPLKVFGCIAYTHV
jgi:transposase InsO family protein